MSSRNKVLIVDSDLDTLSKIYLALVHRNYKAEASNKAEEIKERMKRLKPAILIIGKDEYMEYKESLKIPYIVLWEGNESHPASDNEVIYLDKPIHIETLVHSVESLII